MKKIIVGAFMLVFAAAGAQAQEHQSEGKQHHQKRSHHRQSLQQLGLSEDQKTKFKALNDDYRKQMETLKKQDDITVKDWKGKMKSLKDEHQAKVQNLLTPEQKAKMEKMKTERHSMRKGEGKRQDSKGRMEKMKTSLGLSEDQVASMTKNRTEMSEKMKALRENKSLTDDQRKEQMKELRNKQKESLKGILTEEQMKKLHEKQRRPAKQSV